jgi:hypothetical protein
MPAYFLKHYPKFYRENLAQAAWDSLQNLSHPA